MISFKRLISFPYQLGHAARILFYKAFGLYHHQQLSKPVISVGNFSFGGTGKTPTTIALAKFFASKNLKVAVLSRAYKSSLNKDEYKIINCKTSSRKDFSAEQIGDEACEMLEAFVKENQEIYLCLGRDRYKSGQAAIAQYGCDICILDDGLQYIGLNRDFDLILMNLNEKGFLREFEYPAKKGMIFYTKVNEDWIKQNPSKPYIDFDLELNSIGQTNGEAFQETNLKYKNVGIFTGIADPETLHTMVEAKLNDCGSKISKIKIERFFYPDHHQFSLDEVTRVLSLGINLITTRKDSVKIPEEFRTRFTIADLKINFHPESFLDNLYNRLVLQKDSACEV